MKRFKAFLASSLAAVTVILSLTGVMAFADGDVEINETNFPDPLFRKVVTDNYDLDGSKSLSAGERGISLMALSDMIDPDRQEITSLKGIEYFTELEILRCGGIGLETLDVSPLTKLTELTCQGNLLTELDLSANTALSVVNCSANDLETLILPENSSIKTLYCFANSLTQIDTGRLANVVTFRCDQNELGAVDVSPCVNMTSFNCSKNHITALDLSQTALDPKTVTDYMTGGQTITLTAHFNYHMIVIPFENSGLDNDNYMGCSLDSLDDNSYFDLESFICFDVEDIENGITYECSTKLEGAENMTVSVTVERNFYQVEFYSDDTFGERLKKIFVNSGSAAEEPEVTDIPQCMAFAGWSQNVSCVECDMKVYPVFSDAHSYTAVSLEADGDTVNIVCSDCGNSYQVSFIGMINKTPLDNGFDSSVDVVNDGYINAKDYAVLNRLKVKQ